MITQVEIKNILNNQDPRDLESLAQKAKAVTEQFWGRTIGLYMPLYISNYCSSHCTYCGFHMKNKIHRFKLAPEQIEAELQCIAQKGIENILILTGESYEATPLSYIKMTVQIAARFFPNISLEIHPLRKEEYAELFHAGADGLTVYQETYDRTRYHEVHLAGQKKDYDFRYGTPERAAQAGFRHISLGVLLGLSDLAPDLFALFEHLAYLEKHYPGVEYSLSFPRLRAIKGQSFAECFVDDKTFLKIICLSRILFPRVGINLSTRESAAFRDHAIGLGVTKISAESKTTVGGYTHESCDEAPQFDVADTRTVEEMIAVLKMKHFDPVLTDWRRIPA